jgi:hypothetical protein
VTNGNMTAAGLVMPLVVIALLLLVAGSASVTANNQPSAATADIRR